MEKTFYSEIWRGINTLRTSKRSPVRIIRSTIRIKSSFYWCFIGKMSIIVYIIQSSSMMNSLIILCIATRYSCGWLWL